MKKTCLFALMGILPLLAAEVEPVLPVQIYNFHINEYQFTPNEKHPAVDLSEKDETSIVDTLKTIGKVELLSKKNINILRGDPTSISDIKKAVPYEMCIGENCISLVAEEGYYLDLLPSFQGGSVIIDTRFRISRILGMEKVSGSKDHIPRTSSESNNDKYTFGPSHTVVVGYKAIPADYSEPEHILIITEKQL